MAPKLSVPLKESQLSAALSLQARMPQWVEANRAFAVLRDKVPGFDRSACLLKAVAINQLYSTNVYAIRRMAGHITDVMKHPSAETDILVADIAALPSKPGQKIHRTHSSFASKFVHFFVDEHCPIYDSHAVEMLRFHLGRGNYESSSASNYSTFTQNLKRLQELASLHCSVEELDVYLWIAGQYRAWQKAGDAINVEARDLFETLSPEVKELLETLLPGQPGLASHNPPARKTVPSG